MDSILKTIKSMLDYEGDDADFDTPIIMHINTAFMSLTQIGVPRKVSRSKTILRPGMSSFPT